MSLYTLELGRHVIMHPETTTGTVKNCPDKRPGSCRDDAVDIAATMRYEIFRNRSRYFVLKAFDDELARQGRPPTYQPETVPPPPDPFTPTPRIRARVPWVSHGNTDGIGIIHGD